MTALAISLAHWLLISHLNVGPPVNSFLPPPAQCLGVADGMTQSGFASDLRYNPIGGCAGRGGRCCRLIELEDGGPPRRVWHAV